MEKEKLIALVKGTQQGVDGAAGQLYEATYRDIYYFILKNVSNDTQLAEDLTQDTYIEILDTIGKLEEPGAFTAWSHQIAYHKGTAYFRKRHELLADENEEGQTVFDTIEEDRAEFIPDEALDKEDLKQTILGILQELPEEQRAAIMLRYYKEISVKEIAEIQGVNENTVKSRLNYGRKAVKQAVETYEKKNGIKLHCVGIVPVLLWLFREYALANGVSITTKAAVTTLAAGASGTSVAATAASTGAKVAGKLAIKKVIAGIAAAAVVGGGVAAGVWLSNRPEEKKEEKSMSWYGHESLGVENILNVHSAWIDMDVDKMTDEEIAGTLVITRENRVLYQIEFEGEGVVQEPEETEETEEEKKGKIITYSITFDEPITVDYIWGSPEYAEETLIYEDATDTFVFEKFCDFMTEIRMIRTGSERSETLVKNKVYTGDGYNGWADMGNHKYSFRFQVDKITTTDMKGTMTVYVGDEVVHESKVEGRGFQHGENYVYHLIFETPKQTESEGEIRDFLMVMFHPGEDTIYVMDSLNDEMYKFRLYAE